MRFDWTTLALQIVNLLVLLAILRHFLFRPIADMIARRQAELQALADAAEETRAKADEALAAVNDDAAKTEVTRGAVLAAAQKDAEAQRRDLSEKARAEAARIVAEARSEAERTSSDAEAQALRRARALAETIARRALSALPDPPTAVGFAQTLVEAWAGLGEEERRALQTGSELRLVAAHPISAEERGVVLKILEPLDIADPKIDVDPALIAGLDLRSATGVLRNSLAHDLQRISEALSDGDRPGA